MEYFLKWKGLDQNGRPWENTWEPEENLHPDTIASYNAAVEMMMNNKEPEKKRRSVDKQQPEPAAKKRIVNREKVILSPRCLYVFFYNRLFTFFYGLKQCYQI